MAASLDVSSFGPTGLLVLVVALILGALFLGGARQPQLQRIGPSPGFLGLNLAAAKSQFNRQGYQMLLEAYKNFPGTNYVVQTDDTPRIIVSPRFLDEIHMLPETTLSHRESIVIRHVGHYTGMAIVQQSHLHSDIVRVHMRRNLPKLMPGMAASVDQAISEITAKVTKVDFVKIPAMSYSFFTIARIFSFVSVGEPLCRNKEWIQAAGEYPKVMLAVATVLRPWSAWARPFVAPFLKERSELKKYQCRLEELFKDEINARRKDRNHLDGLQWLIDSAAPHEADDHSIVLKLMFLALGAIHTSALALDHALLDLCAWPEYIEPIRREIGAALSSTGGEWNLETLSKLPKLDSFMQESRRWNHPAALAMHRLALKDVTLSDGTLIPKGWILSIPAEALSLDAEYYKNPDVFDGNRFLSDNDTGKGTTNENGFAKIKPGNLSWGHGRLTCPGRWHADAQIKLVLGKTIQKFDFQLPGGSKERPQNVHNGERIMPDPSAMLEFRLRN